MANSKDLVGVGKPLVNGAVWRAPSNTSVPTAFDDALTGFTCMGYVSSGGVTHNNSKEHEKIKAWGGDTVAVPLTSHSDTFQISFIEARNAEVLKAAYGDDNVTVTTGTGISAVGNADDDTEHPYVIDTEIHGKKRRIVVPAGKVTTVGEITYKDDDVVAYPLTITALPDASGNTHYLYDEE